MTTSPPDLTQGPAFFALRGVTPDFRNGQMQQFNASVQRELGRDMVATVGYVGSAGAKLYWARNINQPDPGPGAVDPRRPYATRLPGVTGITWLESSGNSFFSSMQTTFEKRFSKSVLFPWKLDLVARTRQRRRRRRRERTHSSGSAEPPRGLGEFEQRRSPPRQPRSDVSAAVRTRDGVSLPAAAWSIRSSVDGRSADSRCCRAVCRSPSRCPDRHSNTGAGSRANPVPGVNPIPSNQNINLWFDPNAFATPPAYTWGTLGRNTLQCAGPVQLRFLGGAEDSCSRRSRQLEFRSEFFNGLNHPQFGLPNSTVGVGGAGTITSTQRANRQIQFALRLAL